MTTTGQPTTRRRCRPASERPRASRAQRNAWIESALSLVNYNARRYSGNGVSFDDLCAEGHVGLVEASLRFDPSLNYSFGTYAVWWVRKRMVDALFRQGQAVQVPMRQIRQQRMRNDGSTGSVKVLSLDERRPGQDQAGSDKLADPAGNPLTAVLLRERHARVRGHVDRLPPKEREIVTRRFGLDGREPQSLRQVAAELGLSRERIRQIEHRCLEQLRRKTTR